MRGPKAELAPLGTVFGRLKVVGYLPRSEGEREQCVLQCQCGKGTTARMTHLLRGKYESCGCYHYKECLPKLNHQLKTKHGWGKTSECRIWRDMKRRCFEMNNIGYKNYGGRGITVCDRWMKFENFIEDMGPRPRRGYEIDRIDNNGNYEPGNVRWTTRKVNSNNKRTNVFLTFQGETKTVSQWSEALCLGYGTIQNRLRKGWSTERVLAAVGSK